MSLVRFGFPSPYHSNRQPAPEPAWDPVPLTTSSPPLFLTRATYFAWADFAAARCKRQRFFVAAMILFMPSALIRRLGFGGSGTVGAGATAGSASAAFFAAHRFFRAADSRLRPAGVIPPLRVAGALGAGAGFGVSIPSMPSNAASACSMAVFWRSSWLMMPFRLSVTR
jgi:hypothetical protein